MEFTPPPPPPPPPPTHGHIATAPVHAHFLSSHAVGQHAAPHTDPCNLPELVRGAGEVGGPSAIAIVLPYAFKPEALPDVTTSQT